MDAIIRKQSLYVDELELVDLVHTTNDELNMTVVFIMNVDDVEDVDDDDDD